MHAFWLVLTFDLLEDRRIDDVIIKTFKIFYYINQIDSKLSCVCSVIDHRGCQNVVRTSVTHSAAPRVPLFCSYHILKSSVIYYWTDARQLVKNKLWASRRCVISHPWHIITRLQCTFSFVSCNVGSWWKLMSNDNSRLKCHLRQIIQSVNGCFKPVIFIKTNAHFMACWILLILYFLFAAQQVWRDPMKNLEWNLWKKKRKKLYPPSFMV